MAGLRTLATIAAAYRRAGIEVESIEVARWWDDRTRREQKGHRVTGSIRPEGVHSVTVMATPEGLASVAERLTATSSGRR